MGHDALAKKSIHAMASAIEELIGNHEIERLVLFLQRPDRGDGNDPFDAKLFEAVNVGAEIQFRGKNAVPARMPSKKRDFAAFERAQDISIGRISEWSLLLHFPHVGQAGHGIKPAASDDADFRLRQMSP